MNRLSALVVCLGLLMINPVQVTAWPPQPPTATANAHVLALPSIVNPQRAAPLTDRVSSSTSLPPLRDVAAIAAGGDHTCALTTRGGVKCWGNNSYGQLGNGTMTDRSTPVDVVGLESGVVAIAAGGLHTCALTAGGGVKCWGWNGLGQLGDGTTNDRSTSVDVTGLTNGVTAISAGNYHTCALTTSGSVKCWGHNGYGQLGDGTTTDRNTPTDVVGLGNGVVAIAAGDYHTCALTTGGGIKCWGWNMYGQLGDGTTTNHSTPADVAGLVSGMAAISTKWNHTCALTVDGGVKCWGFNGWGGLGNGTWNWNSTIPVDVAGLTSGVAAIATGWYHTCALTMGGGVKCWGRNRDGQLGEGTTTDHNAPVDVAGLSGTTAVTAGRGHTCALTAGGEVKCWGWNKFGQLGDGKLTQRSTPLNVVGLGSEVVAVAAGGEHTCALTIGSGVKCWGDNETGQLGDSTETDHSTPVDVTSLRSGVKAVTAGWSHTCALTVGGGVKCWGWNLFGQLGDGSRSASNAPRNVVGLASGVVAIAAGSYHTCALTSNGGVKCWGSNEDGEVGDGTTTWRNTPTDVVGLGSGVAAIAAGGGHTCALITGGGVKCWGDNRHGQLGDGTWTQRNTPVDVVGLASGMIAIAAGGEHTCALTAGGGVKCWGNNRYGQLGDGTTTGRSTPVDVVGLGSGVIAIAAGDYQTCALTAGGGTKCWGNNRYGQLGDGTTSGRSAPVDVAGLGSGMTALAAGGEHTCAVTADGGVKCWGWDGSGQLGLGSPTYRTMPVNVVTLLEVYLPLVLRGA